MWEHSYRAMYNTLEYITVKKHIVLYPSKIIVVVYSIDSSDSPQDSTIPTSTGETGNNMNLKGDGSKLLNHLAIGTQSTRNILQA